MRLGEAGAIAAVIEAGRAHGNLDCFASLAMTGFVIASEARGVFFALPPRGGGWRVSAGRERCSARAAGLRPRTVRAEPVEAGRLGFDKLSPNGLGVYNEKKKRIATVREVLG